MRYHQFGNRKTDIAVLWLLALGFPAFCPIAIGRSTFITVHFQLFNWQVGVLRESACFRGYGINSESLEVGPVSISKETWGY